MMHREQEWQAVGSSNTQNTDGAEPKALMGSTTQASPGRINSAQTLTQRTTHKRQAAAALPTKAQAACTSVRRKSNMPMRGGDCSPHTAAKCSLKALAQLCAHNWQRALIQWTRKHAGGAQQHCCWQSAHSWDQVAYTRCVLDGLRAQVRSTYRTRSTS